MDVCVCVATRHPGKLYSLWVIWSVSPAMYMNRVVLAAEPQCAYSTSHQQTILIPCVCPGTTHPLPFHADMRVGVFVTTPKFH